MILKIGDTSAVRWTPDGLQVRGPTLIASDGPPSRPIKALKQSKALTHAITGAAGRFKTGQILDVGAEGLDVYDTMLNAMGSSRRLGPTDRESRSVDSIRA